MVMESIKEFIERVDRLEKRYKNNKYADTVLMPLALLIEVRDEIRQPKLDWEKEQ